MQGAGRLSDALVLASRVSAVRCDSDQDDRDGDGDHSQGNDVSSPTRALLKVDILGSHRQEGDDDQRRQAEDVVHLAILVLARQCESRVAQPGTEYDQRRHLSGLAHGSIAGDEASGIPNRTTSDMPPRYRPGRPA